MAKPVRRHETLISQIAATLLAAAGLLGIGKPAVAAPVEVTSGGTIYTLDVTTCFAPGTIFGCSSAKNFQSNTWFGNSTLSKDLSEATKNLLGLPNASLGTGLGPNFVYQSGDPSQYNSTALPFDGWEWDPVLTRAYARGGLWNSGTGEGTSNTYYLATEAAAPRPASVAGPIMAANNGTSINTTSSLAAKSLLPQFQGGTLVVSAPGVITDAFTLDSSSSNTIDANGVDAEFSGAFTDASGQKGSIQFINNGAGLPNLRLSAQSTYSGNTGIGLSGSGDIAVDLDGPQALPQTTIVEIGARGALGVFNATTIAGLKGQGAVDNSGASLTLGITTGSSLDSSSSLSSSAEIMGDGSLIKDGPYQQILSGTLTYTGPTTVKGGTLIINGTSTSSTTVESSATLGGIGAITGNVTNSGTVSPGNSIGTLTIKGNYTQNPGGTLALEVGAAGSGDLLQINGGRVIDLAGQVLISSAPGTAITPGMVYTGIATNPGVTYTGISTANAAFGSITGNAGFTFVREDDPAFNQLNNGAAVKDPTKLQFGWLQLQPTTGTPIPSGTISTATTPGQVTIAAVKPTGGALTQILTANPTTLIDQCTANTGTGTAFSCQIAVLSGGSSGASGSNTNNISAAKVIDAGISSVYAAVAQGTTGGTPIPTASGAPSGYTSNQALAGAVTPDFVTVYGALFSIPTRSQLNQALHSITAEPYASMQSVALEAMEQFRSNTLALTDGSKAMRLFTEANMCRLDDGSLIPADSERRPDNCQPRKISQASRWSLLIDATNTQANLEGTNDLASLDYNIFQSSYGLQYDASRQWSLGAAFGYGQANLYNYEYANSSIGSNTYSGGVWATYRPADAWKITGLLGYMNLQYDSSRQMVFGGLNRTAQANWSGNGFTSAIDLEYEWVLSGQKADSNAIRLKPNTYLAYSLHNQGTVTETGADSLNLAIDGHTADSLVYGIGFSLEMPVQLSRASRLVPRLAVGYEYDFNANTNEEHQLTASFAEVPALGSLDVLGQNRGANDLNVDLSVELETSEQFSLYAGIGGSFWSNGNELNYGGGVRWRFGGAPSRSIAQSQPAAVNP
jgi:autotransporter-associated beta strand protein